MLVPDMTYWDAAFAFLGAMAVALVLTPIAARIAKRLGTFVKPGQVPEVWAAVTSLFRDYGYRRLRNRARIKFLVADWGPEKFREVLEKEYLGYALPDGPAPVNVLASEFSQTRPAISKHLRVLREAGLVESRAAGRSRLYGLRGEGFADLARWLTPYVLLWQRGLSALERHLDEQEAAGERLACGSAAARRALGAQGRHPRCSRCEPGTSYAPLVCL